MPYYLPGPGPEPQDREALLDKAFMSMSNGRERTTNNSSGPWMTRDA